MLVHQRVTNILYWGIRGIPIDQPGSKQIFHGVNCAQKWEQKLVARF